MLSSKGCFSGAKITHRPANDVGLPVAADSSHMGEFLTLTPQGPARPRFECVRKRLPGLSGPLKVSITRKVTSSVTASAALRRCSLDTTCASTTELAQRTEDSTDGA